MIDTSLSEDGWYKAAYLFISAGSIGSLLSWFFYGNAAHWATRKLTETWCLIALLTMAYIGVLALEPSLGTLST